MRVRGALGMNKQIFFCGMGGFDNHSEQLPPHDNLMGQLDAALGAFNTALETDLQLANETTLFTESEFGRTGNPSSSNGSDDGWVSHHFVLGGSVKGGEAYGTFPTHALRGPDDGNLNTVFPNLRTFTNPNIGFMR